MTKAEFNTLINSEEGKLDINEQFYLYRWTKSGAETVDGLALQTKFPPVIGGIDIAAREFGEAKEEIAEKMKSYYLEYAERQVKRFINGK